MFTGTIQTRIPDAIYTIMALDILKETARLTILKRLCSLAQRFFFFFDKGRGDWFSKTLLNCACVAGPGLPLKK